MSGRRDDRAGRKRTERRGGTAAALLFIISIVSIGILAFAETPPRAVPGLTCRLSYETEADILSDFLSSARIYREARPGTLPKNPLETRRLGLTEGRFGRALHIADGWSVTKGTANESGIDLDLIVATLWGDYRTKPHYWGTGRFFGDRGTVAFWVKRKTLLSDPLYPLFMQSSVAWGRKERDLFRVDVTPEGRLRALLRDIFYNEHTVETADPVWTNGEWQHVAVAFDQAYGLKLYYNGKLVASSWGKDAWWQTPLPGLFSPFLPEADYDEIALFDYPLEADQVQKLFASNEAPGTPARRPPLDEAARRRLLLAYGDVESLALPTLRVGRETLALRQARVTGCHDENIPAWWAMDGRYELAWPHPYRLFTFILGDVDFHGTKLDVDLAPGEKPNYLTLEGVLDGAQVFPGTYKDYDKTRRIAGLDGYPGFFYSTRLELGSASSLHFPMLKGYGTPEGLVDHGTLRFPLTGRVRIHEVGLWRAEASTGDTALDGLDVVWPLAPASASQALDLRYLDAFLKLAGPDSRTLFLGSRTGRAPTAAFVDVAPLQSFHFMGADLNPDPAITTLGLSFTVVPEKNWDVLWVSLRDPGNPSRLWAKTAIRLEFSAAGQPQRVSLRLNPIDLLLAAEDRLWLELRFANGERILTDPASLPRLGIRFSQDREKSLAEYAAWEMIPAQTQYMKEYNYQPWLFTGEQRNVSTLAFPGGLITMTPGSAQGQSLKFWTNFGGPYDMWYPPQAVLRHDPTHRIAGIYGRLTGERARTYGAYADRTLTPAQRLGLTPDIPASAPAWAVWEREVYVRHRRTAHWIVDQQREDGFFWGGYKDDVFIPLGFADLPFMGDEKTRRSFLREYDGVDEVGAFKDGLCQVWPSDYLHITNILVSRGLMVPYALGDPYVLEREMITARVYGELMDEANAERAKAGLAAFVYAPEASRKEPKLWGQQLIHDYEKTQVLWYWGKTPPPPPHALFDREGIARKMMAMATGYDDTEEYGWTRAMHHTDRYGEATPGRTELITAALGGRLQGRIEPLPHSLVVSWSDPDPALARLVSSGDERSVRFNLYNFGDASRRETVRLWRIQDGEYLMKVGEDGDDDGLIDAGKPLLAKSRLDHRRFGTAEIDIPPQKNIAVSLELIKPRKRPTALPDLAVGAARDVRQTGDRLAVTVHNIGDAPAANFTVEALDESGRVIDRKVVRSLAAPLDFLPKTAAVTLDLHGRTWQRVVLDRGQAVAEIFKGNNEALNPGGR